ncbi:hypothetical protein GPK34_00330 [Secundilactobacillus kimchicus]|uniref:hypothetical protein n=1 Tax=Secundilactobacillus kimchicus TaxID=528209 RepID=UPI001C00B286|nr:hypothetical protein [Secundilactobacillus kimchicus]MBT9670483.1 hypothetical protein [Secundilactobacillus kimchicus]
MTEEIKITTLARRIARNVNALDGYRVYLDAEGNQIASTPIDMWLPEWPEGTVYELGVAKGDHLTYEDAQKYIDYGVDAIYH